MERRSFLKLLSVLPFVYLSIPFDDRKKKTRRVLLLDTVVAGFRYYDDERIWDNLSDGDALILVRKPGNPYDERAVEVYHKYGKLGYIPREIMP